MNNIRNFTSITEKEDETYNTFCPELDLASQDETIEKAKKIFRKQLNYYLSMHPKMK